MAYNAEYQRQWRQKNREKSKNYTAEWRIKNPEYGPKAHVKRMLGEKSRALLLLKAARRRAKLKNSQFSLKLEDVLPKIQKGKCELTGLDFDFSPPGKFKRNPYAPSIDRIDSLKGYTPDNSRVVLVAVNDCLNQYGEDTILPILQALIKGIKRNAKKKSVTPIPNVNDRKRQNKSSHGVVHGARPGQNGNDIDGYRGADARKDVDCGAQASSGDSLGHGGEEVGAFDVFDHIESSGALEAAPRRLREAFERLRSQSREPSLAAGTASEIRQFGD